MDCIYSPWGHKESDMTEQLSLHLPWLSAWQLSDVELFRGVVHFRWHSRSLGPLAVRWRWVPTPTLDLSLYSRFKGTSRPLPEPKTLNKGGITHFSISGGGDGGLAAKSCLTLECPSLSLGFSRQEYWSGLPFPSPSLYILGYNIMFRVIFFLI